MNNINTLSRSISPQRLQRFLSHSGDDFEKALKLYEQNMRMSAGFYLAISCFEVCLRNHIHETMKETYGVDWLLLEGQTPLKQDEIDTAIAVYEKLQTYNKINDNVSENMGRVVSELSLGFWVRLLGKKYEKTLWRPTLRHAFPNYRGNFKPLSNRVHAIRDLRNAIAHQEPIVFINGINGKHDEIIETIGWMCADTKDWVARMVLE